MYTFRGCESHDFCIFRNIGSLGTPAHDMRKKSMKIPYPLFLIPFFFFLRVLEEGRRY
jgi:hypothetical protein